MTKRLEDQTESRLMDVLRMMSREERARGLLAICREMKRGRMPKGFISAVVTKKQTRRMLYLAMKRKRGECSHCKNHSGEDSMCQTCRDKNRKHLKDRYQRLKDQGLCVYCRRPAEVKLLCRKCSEKKATRVRTKA